MNGSPNSVDALPWPVRRLLDLQEARLPAWMKSEDLSSYYVDTREYYLAHVTSADAAIFAPDEQFSLEEQRLLRNLFALVLRQAMAIRGYNNEHCYEKIVLPEVLVMVSIILCECFPSSTHGHHSSVMFAVSRKPGGDSYECPAIGLRRRAELVVSRICGAAQLDSTYVDPIDDDGSDALADGDAHSDMEGQDGSFFSGFTQYGHPQQLLYSRSPDSQGPTDACVAHSSNIHPLLTSALYHCLSVGTSGPLVGLSYEKTSPTVHAYTVWLEEAVEEGDDLPSPHILPPIPFDLTEPLSALKLALLLHRTSSVHEWSPQTADETLPWRADICARHILDDTPLSHADFSNHETIAVWAQEVYEATFPYHRSVDMEPKKNQPAKWPPPAPRSISSKDDKSKDTRARSQAKVQTAETSNSQSKSTPSAPSGRPTTPKLSNATMQPSQKSAQSEGTSSPAGSVKTVRTFLSASTFVKRKKDLPRPRTQRYFVVRKVVFCDALKGLEGRITVPEASIHGIALVWFSGDQADLRMCICTEQEHLLTELLEGYARYSTCFIGYMTPAVQPIIQRTLHGIFQVIQAVRLIGPVESHEDSADEGAPAMVHNEATYRFHWDQLIQTVVERGEIDGVGYRKEAKLRYGEFSAPQTYAAQGGFRSDVFDLYQELLPYAQPGQPGVLPYNWHNEVISDAFAMSEAAAQEEPRSGTADGILYLGIPGVFFDEEVADAMSIWTPAVASDSSKDDDVVDTWSTEESEEQPSPKSYGGSVFSGTPRRPVDPRARAGYQKSFDVAAFTDPKPTRAAARTSSPAAPKGDGPNKGKAKGDSSRARKAFALMLFLPLLVCEFNRLLKGWTEEAATDQERLALVSICTIMRVLNISRFPIFGLVTSGSIGVLSSAWNQVTTTQPTYEGGRTTAHNVIYIADQQATTVDIRNPLDALNVATFIAYVMTEHAARLRQLFESIALDDVDSEYLLDKSLTPLAKAHSLTVKDGHWHKPQSEKQVEARRAATKLEAVAEQSEPG